MTFKSVKLLGKEGLGPVRGSFLISYLKLSVVYEALGEVGGGYNSGGFPISYYITTQSPMYDIDFVCFIPSKYLTWM